MIKEDAGVVLVIQVANVDLVRDTEGGCTVQRIDVIDELNS